MSKTAQHSPEQKTPSTQPPASVSKKSKTPASGKKSVIAIIALLIAVVALAGVAYIGWRGQNIEQLLPSAITRIQQVDSRVSSQGNQLNSTLNRLAPIEQQSKQLVQRDSRLLDRIDQLSKRVRMLEGSTRVDWHLAEVEYLLRLANQRLLMSSDIIGARKLLANASDMLQSIDDYNLFGVREALAEDISVLQTVPAFDQEAVYMQLNALGAQINSLVLLKPNSFNPTPASDTSTTTPSNDDTNTDWKTTALSALDQAWTGFSSLFRFTSSRERPVEVLLTPEQDTIVRQNLSLLMEQSKLALLSRQETIYKDSLEQTKKWITQYFAKSDSKNQAMLKALSSLSVVDINPPLPSINRSLEALKTYQLQASQQKAIEKADTPAPTATPEHIPEAEVSAQ